MKRLLSLAIMLMLPSMAAAQVWQNTGAFPPDGSVTGSGHGVAVDAEGKVWIQPWSEAIVVNDRNVAPIRVYNPDGTEVDFSPITTITVNGVTDTLGAPGSANRGLTSDHQGNIIASIGARFFHFAPDGSGIRVTTPGPVTPLTAAAVSDDGFIAYTYVIPGNPIGVLDETFTPTIEVLAEREEDTFSRVVGISGDATQVYSMEYVKQRIRIFDGDPFTGYTLTDSLVGPAIESAVRHPVTGEIWFAGGSVNDPPVEDSGFEAFKYYSWVPALGVTTEHFMWDTTGADDPRPRGLAFSPDGLTAYAIAFNNPAARPMVQRFTLADVSIERDSPEVPAGYVLGQNYPNPFNPSTTFNFKVAEAGHVHLAVFDVLGREVDVLANEFMPVGSYSATFEASPNLPSGTYFYILEANGHRMTQKMVLLK